MIITQYLLSGKFCGSHDHYIESIKLQFVVLLKVVLQKLCSQNRCSRNVEKLNSTNESETLQGKGWSREEKLQPRK